MREPHLNPAHPLPPAPTLRHGRPLGPRGLPDHVLVGVSDSGFQSEGGFNGPGEPRNNWALWEREGRVEPAGEANQFWRRYPEHFERAAELGCTAYRTSVEWTRVEPARGAVDREAIAHYARIVRAMHGAGLEPVVALHHFTHPAWCGQDFWLRDEAPARFAQWAETIVAHLAPWVRNWTTVNEPNALAIGSHLMGYFPPGQRVRPDRWARMVDNLLAAHVAAYDVIHRHRPDAQVGWNTYAFWSYDADRLLTDALLWRSEGVGAHELDDWFATRRDAFHTAVLRGIRGTHRWRERAVQFGLEAVLRPQRRLHNTFAAVARSPHERTLDVTQVSWYDPALGHYPRWPGRHTGGERRWGIDPAHWEQRPAPEHLASYLQATATDGMPTWILELGMCTPVVDGVAHPRRDGWDRPTYLARHLDAILEARDAGVDVDGIFHWALFDNHQWGESISRFGLYATDRTDGSVKFGDLDAAGHDSATAFRDLVAAARRGNRASA